MAISLQRYEDLLFAAERYRVRYERLRNAVIKANTQRSGDQVLWTLMTWFADHQEEGREHELKDIATIMAEIAHHKATHKGNLRRQRWRAAKAGYPMPSAGPLPYHQLDPSALMVTANTPPLAPHPVPTIYEAARTAPSTVPEYELAPPPAPRAPPPPKLPIGPDGFVDNSRLGGFTTSAVRQGFAAPAPTPHPDADAMAALAARLDEEEAQAMAENARALPQGPQGGRQGPQPSAPTPRSSPLDE